MSKHMKQRFAKVDPRFGPVPLWWWSGEEITSERICWQLQKLHAGGIRNVCIINLAPTGPQFGSVADRPVFLSEDWWSMFGTAVREAERLGMYVWFYDQIGFSGANLPARIVAESPECSGYQLRRYKAHEILPESAEVIFETDEYRYVTVRQGFNWLDRTAAKRLLDWVHGEVERRFTEYLGRTIVGSFQDELPPLPMWTPEVIVRYRERYGEDLVKKLPCLFDPEPNAAQVRRQVYQLAAELAEEAFFIPLGKWHERHGLLLGCDQAGPARRVEPNGAQRLYLDYFRQHRWFNAPGADMDGEIKPHSSLVHLHGGKRVWIEAFHSSGWGGSLEETMHWLIPWLQAGATLYNPHAVYYTTQGGWWEWAPPDTGWRQPYFEHYHLFADTISRVCWLLSQGTHVADIAVHYPSYAVTGHLSINDAGPAEHPMAVANRDPDDEVKHISDVYWSLTGHWNRRDQHHIGALRSDHRDFDIVDDLALQQAVIEGQQLCIREERFSVMLLCGTLQMAPEAQSRLRDWVASGGLVIGVGVRESPCEIPGVVHAATADKAVALIRDRVPRRVDGTGMFLHHHVDDEDVFLLLPKQGSLLPMHVPADPSYKFQDSAHYRLRTNGIPELWDPVSGTTSAIPYLRNGEWIDVELSFESWPAALVVCGKTNSAADSSPHLDPEQEHCKKLPHLSELVDADSTVFGLWKVHVTPTLDNHYGDFDRHGALSDVLPVERRQVRVQLETEVGLGELQGWNLPAFDDTRWNERMWSEAAYWLVNLGDSFDEQTAYPAVYSTAYGDLTTRTWEGRMGRVPRRFLNLGNLVAGQQAWARTYVLAPDDGQYWIRLNSDMNVAAWVDNVEVYLEGEPGEQTAWVSLARGSNELLLCFTVIQSGLVQIGVEVNSVERPRLPKWLSSKYPSKKSRIGKSIDSGDSSGKEDMTGVEKSVATQRVRIVFAARGRAALYVNGVKITEHGDFHPYLRHGEEEVDVTQLWRPGSNEISLALPEGQGQVFIDGLIERTDGSRISFSSDDTWQDEQGYPADVAPGEETDRLWITPRPHPLPDVGWLMPESAPQPKPLPMVLDPTMIDQPVWLRFPLPAGAYAMYLNVNGQYRVWINGEEILLNHDKGGIGKSEVAELNDAADRVEGSHRGGLGGGWLEFTPQSAGTLVAVLVEPVYPMSEGAVLKEPIRFKTDCIKGELGDWRTVLCLPHYSGAVEYENTFYVGKNDSISGQRERAGVSTPAILDLGHVRGTAEVWVDGRNLGTRIWRPYRFELEDLHGGEHHLRIRVTNTLGPHYEIGRPTTMVGHYSGWWTSPTKQKEQISQEYYASGGLFGPIRLI